MVALSRFTMSDLARQKRLAVELSEDGELTPSHTVGRAIEYFKDRMQIGDSDLRWSAFSRGVLLDNKRALRELEATDTDLTVMPEVSAG